MGAFVGGNAHRQPLDALQIVLGKGLLQNHDPLQGVHFLGCIQKPLQPGSAVVAADDEEGVKVVEIDLDRTEYVRRGWPFFRDRRIDAYGETILKRYGK